MIALNLKSCLGKIGTRTHLFIWVGGTEGGGGGGGGLGLKQV